MNSAFDRAWLVTKREKYPNPPYHPSPPCEFCGNTDTTWKMEPQSLTIWALRDGPPPIWGVWCEREFTPGPSCGMFSIPDKIEAAMALQPTVDMILGPDYATEQQEENA